MESGEAAHGLCVKLSFTTCKKGQIAWRFEHIYLLIFPLDLSRCTWLFHGTTERFTSDVVCVFFSVVSANFWMAKIHDRYEVFTPTEAEMAENDPEAVREKCSTC